MRLTKPNIKKVIEDNFGSYIDIELVGIKKSGDVFTALSKPQGINAEITQSPEWEDNLITHIKWQLNI